MSGHGRVTAPLRGRPKVGQHVMVERIFYRGGEGRSYREQAVVEVVRQGEAVIRCHGYTLTVPWSDLQLLVKNFSKRGTRHRLPR